MPRNVSITVTFDSSELVELLETVRGGVRPTDIQHQHLESRTFTASERCEITRLIQDAVERGVKAEVSR